MSVGGEVFGRCLGSELRGEVSPGFGHCSLCVGKLISHSHSFLLTKNGEGIIIC